MADETTTSEWTQRMDRLLAGTSAEQVREAVEGVRADIAEAVESQAERILGGFAQRVGQLQASILETRGSLEERIDALERARPAADGGPAADAVAGMIAEALREPLQALEVGIRTEIDHAGRQRTDGDAKQQDALGLRITNMSMAVTQALDGVRSQVDAMTERAARLEAEQAAILESIRSHVSGIGGSVGEEVGARTSTLAQEVGDRLRALEGIGDRLDQLDGITARLARLEDMGERLDAIASQAGALAGAEDRIADRLGGALGPLEEIRAALADVSEASLRLGAIPQIEEQLRTLEQRVEILPSLVERLEPLPRIAGAVDAVERVEAELQRVREDVAALPTIREHVRALSEGNDGPTREDLDGVARAVSAIGEQVASIEERIRTLGGIGGVPGALEELRATVGGIAGSLEGLQEVRASLGAIGAGIDRLPEQLGERLAALDGLQDTLAGIGARLEGLDSLDQLPAVREDLANAVSRLAVRLDGVESGVARTIIDVRGALEETGRGSSEALDGLARELRHLSERLERLDTTAGSLRAQITALPGSTEISEAVTRDVSGAMSAFRLASDARLGNVERDLGSVATNVNEIWMRMRAALASLEALNEMLTERSRIDDEWVGETREYRDWMGRGIEHIARSEQRLSGRLSEVEERLVAASVAVEAERDRIFVDVVEAMIDRLSRGERTLKHRLRSLIGGSRRGSSDDDGVPAFATAAEESGTNVPVPAVQPERATKEGSAAARRKKTTRRAKTTAKTKRSASSKTSTSKTRADADAKPKVAKPAKRKTTARPRATAARAAKKQAEVPAETAEEDRPDRADAG